jgi:hypothetical protein
MNNEWKAFLESRGIGIEDGVAAPTPEDLGDCNLFDLGQFGLIRVGGEDAVDFLQGQLTNDVRALTADHSQLSSYCSPKGRMMASFRLFRLGDDILIQLPRTRLGPILRRLRMFVLRSKVTLEDASDDLVQIALAGDCAPEILGDLAPGAADETVQGDGLVVVRVAGDRPRFLATGTPAAITALWQQAANRAIPAGASAWRLLDIRAGIPVVEEETVEAFVPQMTNLQLINGVSFTKGCYTGQEVVARMQYLGKLKRRMFRVSIDTDPCPAAGTELFSPRSASGQGAGRIVSAAPAPGGGCEALAVVETAVAESGDVHAGSNEGPVLKFLDLPYQFEEQKAS